MGGTGGWRDVWVGQVGGGMCGWDRWVEGCVGGTGGWRDVWVGQVGGGIGGRGRGWYIHNEGNTTYLIPNS